MKNQVRLVVVLGANAALFLGVGAVAQDETDAAFSIEEIIVTAQKREQNLQDLGMSVTGLDRRTLDRGGITDISRIELLTPGVTYGFIGTDAKISIRGANSNNTFRDNASIAGVFIDGVYLPRAAQQRLGYFDVARIEVLKGPQGTLYGRNTFAGAINVHTNNPSTDNVQGGIDVTASRFSKARIEAYVNAPISDQFAFRAAGVIETSDGWIKNIGSGRDLGIDDQKSYRLSALWLPNDRIEVIARFTSLKEGGTTAGIFSAEGLCAPVNSTGLTDMLGSEIDCTNPLPGSAGVDSAFDRPYVVNYSEDYSRDVTSDNAIVDLSWDLDKMTLKSITSWTEFTSAYTSDSDFSGNPGARSFWDEDIESITQELQVSSSGDGRFQWVFGAYYSDDDLNAGFSSFRTPTWAPHTITGMDDLGNVITTFHPTDLIDPWGGGNFNDFDSFQLLNTKTTGLFGQIDWSLTESFRLIAGLRDNEETKETELISGESGFTATDAPFDFIGLVGRPAEVYTFPSSGVNVSKETFDKVTWRAGFEWDASDDLLLYSNASTGFLSGGLNTNGSSFEQQDSEAIEIGIKSRLLGNRLQLNAALYRNEYSNLTTQELIPIGGVFVTVTRNGGDVTTNGAEIELIWIPTDDLMITANASFIDNEYGNFGIVNPFQLFEGIQAGDVNNGFVNLKGTTPPWSPETTLGITAAYEIDMGSKGRLTPYVQFYYSDDYTTDDVSLYSTQVQDSFTKTDLRLTWTSANDQWSVTGFIENLEDEAVLARAPILVVMTWSRVATCIRRTTV